jgi:sulfite reductase (NADPH) flavoprotein alpha-component
VLKKIWFQTHWLLGISAGIVLAIVGVTGGMLSFEQQLLRAINPGVMSVTPHSTAMLTPAELLARVSDTAPDKRVTALVLSADPTDAVRLTFAPQGKAPAGRKGPRGETRYADPYTGELLGQPRGVEFFRTVRQIHRWLAADDIGKQVVGASTVALIVLALSGLYLRWPRRWSDVRAWFTFRFAHKGRSFLWGMHSVVGTWVLIPYLLMALTGLYWSYDWYRNALFDMTGTSRPVVQGEPRGDGEARTGDERNERTQRTAAPIDIDALWQVFRSEAGAFESATLRLPERAGEALRIDYLPRGAAHERASNRLLLDAASGAIKRHERYAEKPVGAQIMASIFPLHSGSFFGVGGVIALMIASLLMPLFAITGWMLYLDRRKTKKAARTARGTATSASATGARATELLIGFASQTGFAEQLAWQTAGSLQAAGVPVTVRPLGSIDRDGLSRFKQALFIVSTFGQGEPPDNARGFVRGLMRESLSLQNLRFGLLAIGDRHYQTFCGFGQALEQWLQRHGAQPIFDRVELDRRDASALRDWHNRLRTFGAVNGPAPLSAEYTHWRLATRLHLNPGSAGEATFHLELEPADAKLPAWCAGDLVDVLVQQTDERVAEWLAPTPFDGGEIIQRDGRPCTLAAALKRCELQSAGVPPDMSAQTLIDGVPALAPRAFSIASLPQDGRVHLLVRQSRLANGQLGLASAWLTQHLQPGAGVELRVRTNAGFHLDDSDAPLILIGNGTGMAGLMAHLKQRVRAGRRRNWLVYGERNAAHDYYYRHEIESWQAHRFLSRIDVAFSRDQAERLYVQHRLQQAASDVVAWVNSGAAIYVCGSLQGMAQGADRVLRQILGAERLDELAANGRYRRDVY